MDPMPEGFAALDAELSGRRSWPRLEPGVGAVLVALGVLLLLGAYALPWTGSISGWRVLLGEGGLGILPRLFATTAVLFGVLGSAAALMTQLWALGWACALGGGFSVVNGMWAVWSRQTAGHSASGPAIGLVLALILMALLTTMWVRIAWSRPGGRAEG